MSGYQDTFKRYEMKYRLDEIKYRQLRQRLQDKLMVDSFGKTSICNIYYDTPDHRLIKNSLEKPIYKEKLRLRSYGTPCEGDMVFIELKKKYKGIVYKRRVKMELFEAECYLEEKEAPQRQTQITKEIDWFMNSYDNLIPAMYIAYNRIAMYGIEDPALRITFDSNILWRVEELGLGYGMWGNPILEEGQRLMEIKIPGTMPLWLAHILDELKIYPTSFSKYGRGYLGSLEVQKNKKTKGEKIYA